MKKRGASSEPAADIAVLILLILLTTVVYVILLPPEEREALLQEEDETDDLLDRDTRVITEEVLLSVSPGELFAFKKEKIRKKLTPVSLFQKQEDEVLNLASRLEILRSPFSEETKKLSFQIDGINDIEEAKLFFFIKQAKGDMFIKLNNNVIFEGYVAQETLPIKLPINLLNTHNVLELGVKGIFWNKYTLTEVNVKTVHEFENLRAKRTFELSNKEKAALEKGEMEYYVNCLTRTEGRLSIMFNGKLLSDNPVFCDAGRRIVDINKRNFKAGTNTLEFMADRGTYTIEGLEMELEIGERMLPAYNFEITNDVYKNVFNDCYTDCEEECDDDCRGNIACYNDCMEDCEEECDHAAILLEMTFEDEEERKKAVLTINEHEININTHAPEYTRLISNYIRHGSNSIKIVPKSDFGVINLMVSVI